MSDVETKKFIITTLSKGAVSELHHLHERCDDRDTARQMFDALQTLTHRISRRWDFALTRDDKSGKSQSG